MEFLSRTWRERPRAFVVGSKRNPKMLNGDSTISHLVPTTSQWSPISVTFEPERPHLLLKRTRSFKSTTSRRPTFQPIEQQLNVTERKSKLLNIVILPLTRRKSKNSHASPTSSDTSSLSSHTSKNHSFSLRRSASQASIRHPRASTPVPPLPNSIPPVPNLPETMIRPGKKIQRRLRTADSANVPGRQHPLPTRLITDVGGYWDHIELLDVQRSREAQLPLPRRPHRSPIPF